LDRGEALRPEEEFAAVKALNPDACEGAEGEGDDLSFSMLWRCASELCGTDGKLPPV